MSSDISVEAQLLTAAQPIRPLGEGLSDDDFFHITCHLEPTMIHKIENGEFVELEKLLPKDKLNKRGSEERFE